MRYLNVNVKTKQKSSMTTPALAMITLFILIAGMLLPLQAQNKRSQEQVPPVTHNTWTSGTPMPTARYGAAFGLIKGKIYVVSGATKSAVVTNNEIYNPATNTWTTGAPIPTARYVPASAVVKNILYVIGGCNSSCASGGGATTVVEAYDPSTNTWSEKAPVPVAIDSVYAVQAKNIIYVVGGYVQGPGRVSTLYSYNPVTNAWAQLASMKVGRSNPATGILGEIFVAGGLGNGGITTDTESYGAAKNVWKTLPSMPTGLSGSCFGAISGSFYVASGTANGGGPDSIVEAYTTKTKAWTTDFAPIPQGTVVPASAVVKGQLYCIGGADTGALFADTVYNNVQIYQP